MIGRCSTPGVEGCSWPSYSLTDTDGVVHTCTVRHRHSISHRTMPFQGHHAGDGCCLVLYQGTYTPGSFFVPPSFTQQGTVVLFQYVAEVGVDLLVSHIMATPRIYRRE